MDRDKLIKFIEAKLLSDLEILDKRLKELVIRIICILKVLAFFPLSIVFLDCVGIFMEMLFCYLNVGLIFIPSGPRIFHVKLAAIIK